MFSLSISSHPSVILLQIVMVLEKNDDQVPVKITSPKLKMLRPLCNQTVYLKTDSKTLY